MISDEVQRRMTQAVEELDRRLRAEGRCAIGTPYWIEENGEMRLAVDSVPLTTVKLLGRDEVYRRYNIAKEGVEDASQI